MNGFIFDHIKGSYFSRSPMLLSITTDITDTINWEIRTKLADGMALTATLLITINDAEQNVYAAMPQNISALSLIALAAAPSSFGLHEIKCWKVEKK